MPRRVSVSASIPSWSTRSISFFSASGMASSTMVHYPSCAAGGGCHANPGCCPARSGLHSARRVPMSIAVEPVSVAEIAAWRELYREEMNCQIIRDNMHARRGWTEPYRITVGGEDAGYASILVGGPWKGTRTIFEYYLAPAHRSRSFDAFEKFLAASDATAMTVQTNDPLLTVMLHLWARDITSEKIVFADRLTTARPLAGAVLRPCDEPEGYWAVEIDGTVVANGGILYHYNPPYGDIYMEVAEPH